MTNDHGDPASGRGRWLSRVRRQRRRENPRSRVERDAADAVMYLRWVLIDARRAYIEVPDEVVAAVATLREWVDRIDPDNPDN